MICKIVIPHYFAEFGTECQRTKWSLCICLGEAILLMALPFSQNGTFLKAVCMLGIKR